MKQTLPQIFGTALDNELKDSLYERDQENGGCIYKEASAS